MSQFYLGQIMMTGFSFAQRSFAQCNGQLISVQQNQALFSLLGTFYGGNGTTTFGLPDMRSRTPVGAVPSVDSSWRPPATAMGQMAGTESVTLTIPQMPLHTHLVTVSSNTASSGYPEAGLTLGTVEPNTSFLYGEPTNLTPLGGGPLAPTGGNQPHSNIQPYEAINFNIALQGIFPSRQ
jgi:microcystin-dependent protein